MSSRFVVAVSCVVVVSGSLLPQAAAAPPGAKRDFDRDGFDDLVIGVPNESIPEEGLGGTGAIHILYGSANKITIDTNEYYHQDANGIDDEPEESDGFGVALAIGDFNGDHKADLAIGVCGEDVNGQSFAGAVHILYGKRAGLKTTGQQFITQDTGGISDSVEAGDHFGCALAAGDVNADGQDDLVIGVPGEDINGVESCGAVHVLFGTSTGLQTDFDQFFHRDVEDVRGLTEESASFGNALAMGDFNGFLGDDLAVGVQSANDSRGEVHVIYSDSIGLNPSNFVTDDQIWDEESPGILGDRDEGDRFGQALIAGDFNHDRKDDLAIGTPGNGGVVHVLYGRGGLKGLTSRHNQMWQAGAQGLPGRPNQTFSHGYLVSADFNNDGFDDLAFGGAAIDSDQNAVIVLFGSSARLTATGAKAYTQETKGVVGTSQFDDEFGFSLTTGDFNGDSFDDLVIGASGEHLVDNGVERGGVYVLYGSSTGPKGSGSQFFTQDTPGIPGEAENLEHFGSTLGN